MYQSCSTETESNAKHFEVSYSSTSRMESNERYSVESTNPPFSEGGVWKEMSCAASPKVLKGVDPGGREIQQFSILRGIIWQIDSANTKTDSTWVWPVLVGEKTASRPKITDPRTFQDSDSHENLFLIEEYELDGFDGDVDERHLLVSNLNDNANDTFLENEFGKYGTLYKVEVHMFKGKHSGLASVQYNKIRDALWVSKVMDKKILMGKEIKVQCDPNKLLLQSALEQLETHHSMKLSMVSPVTTDIEVSREVSREENLDETAEKNGNKQNASKLHYSSRKDGMPEKKHPKVPWKNPFENDTERVYAPALKLAMLPLSIQEQDILTFFRKVHPFKVVESGPYWIVVFCRERDRRHILRKLFRDPNENARISGRRFHFEKYDYFLSEDEEREYRSFYKEQSEDKISTASRSEVLREATRMIRALLMERIIAQIEKTIIDQTVGRVISLARNEMLAKNSTEPYIGTSSYLAEIPTARYDAALLDYDMFRKQSTQNTKHSDKRQNGLTAKRLKSTSNTSTFFSLDSRQSNETVADTNQQSLRSIGSREALQDIEREVSEYSWSDDDLDDDVLVEDSDTLEENPCGCARAEPFVSNTKSNATTNKRPKLGRTVKNATLQVSSARESRQEYRKLRQGVGELGIRHSDSLTVSQLKSRKKRVRFGRSVIHGWGLYAMQDIEPNEFIIEYVGEIIRQKISDEREKRYFRQGIGDSYMFRLDEDQVIDATRKGSVARFVNHSCESNAVAKIITIDNSKKIVFYSKRLIRAGEEITYDYKFNTEDENNKILCLCGAPTCRKFLN